MRPIDDFADAATAGPCNVHDDQVVKPVVIDITTDERAKAVAPASVPFVEVTSVVCGALRTRILSYGAPIE